MRFPATALIVALLGVVAALTAPAEAPSAERHFELRRSAPGADSALAASPDRIQLWFSQEPLAQGALISLVDAGGEVVELGATAVVPDTATSLRAEVLTPLASGSYTVHWRAMASDGHVVTGEIPFSVRADSSAR